MFNWSRESICRCGMPFYRILAICSFVGIVILIMHFLMDDDQSIHIKHVTGRGRDTFYNNSVLQASPNFNFGKSSSSFKLFADLYDKKIESYEIKSCLSPDLEKHEESTCRFFAIMIDAGSTGTRVHIFEFSHDIQNKAAPFKLEQEVYGQVTPGLSHYMSDPTKAAESILPLLKKAKSTVPKSQWQHTPISLKATAGLRLLSPTKADEIIKQVDQLLDSSGFLTNEESVSIMSGIDEGIFGWFTLNFLLDRLGALKEEPLNDLINSFANKSSVQFSVLQTVAALDLGGGSTQITFRPKLNSTLVNAPDAFIRQIKLVGRFIDIYTHSYLGNGLMASRLGSLKMDSVKNNIANSSTNFYTSCLHPSMSKLWKYNDIMYNVSGKSPYNFENCLAEQEFFTNTTIDHYPVELASRDIYIFGYFFDRAKQAGIISGNGGSITINDFVSATKKVCLKRRLGSKDHEEWMCRDLSYIVALLKAYKLPGDKKLIISRRIRNMEVSWALGAAHHLLNSYHESRKSRSINKITSSPYVTSQRNHCPCDTMLLMSGSVLKADWLNLTTLFLCSRLYSGLLSILPSAFAQFA